LPVSEDTLRLVQEGLLEVVSGERGTGRRIRVNDFHISGKTGTSQVISRKDNDDMPEDQVPAHLRAHAWFVAYAPSEAARIVVSVVVEHGEHGSGAAAPIAKELIKTYLRGSNSTSRIVAQKAVFEDQ
jgi:penicillin-binding protein 2